MHGLNVSIKGGIIIRNVKQNKEVDFGFVQIYFRDKEVIDNLNKDFKDKGLTNKSDYIRDLVEIGLEATMNKSITSIRKKDIDDLSNTITNGLASLDAISLHIYDMEDNVSKNKEDLNNILSVLKKNNEELKKENKELLDMLKQLTRAMANVYNYVDADVHRQKLDKKLYDQGYYDKFFNDFIDRGEANG